MAKIPFSPAIAEALINRALEAEHGIAISLDDEGALNSMRNRIYEAGVPENLQISFMDNPKEIWIVKKSIDLVEVVNGR